MFVPLVFLTLFIAPSSGASDTLMKFTALQFTQQPTSYIQFRPDFSRFTHAISVCGWIKSLGSSGYPTVFHYGHYEMTLLDNGRWICILGSCTHMSRKFSVSKGTWYHVCVVWSASSTSHKYYVDGELLGTLPTRSDRLLKTGEEITLGNWGGDYYIDHEFGGQMFYLNFYAKEISASEIQRMVTDGMCANMVLEEHEDARLLKWEDILKQSRSGTVTEVDLTGSCISTLLSQVIQKLKTGEVETTVKAAENKLNETAEELIKTRQKLEDREEMEVSLTQELQNVSNQLSSALAELEDVSEELSRKNGELNECYRNLSRQP